MAPGWGTSRPSDRGLGLKIFDNAVAYIREALL